MSEIPLQGKTALVTGASRGLGVEIARQLAAAGASVAMIARDAIKRLTPIRDFDKAKEKDTLLCAPANVPNLLLELHQPVVVTGFFGIRRQTQRIAFHADDPAGLIGEVSEWS